MSQQKCQTLYRPQFEHDACGIGFIARTTGVPGHDIVKMGLEAVGCMEHRSGIDADGLSGDGAGILTQIPHQLLAAEINNLPEPGDYGLGMLFLPLDDVAAAVSLTEAVIGQVIAPALAPETPATTNGSGKNGSNGHHAPLKIQNSKFKIQNYLQWRTVPVNVSALGRTAQKTRPEIRQIIIRRPEGIAAGEPFERLLFTIRKRLVQAYRAAGMTDGVNDAYYVASLSSRTVVYKGLMLSPYLADFYLDLTNPLFESALAVVHARYSTNTTSNWTRAQPLRMLAHNGEINTIAGNENWIKARESTLESPHWPHGMADLWPIVDPQGSDSSRLDNVLELLVRAGRDVHHAMAMLAPEAWESLIDIHPDRHAFYRYHAALIEPWDGPAALLFTDGRRVGATLDRNGLRPLRYITTSTDLVIATSEAGAVNIDEGLITTKGKLGPGQMILVDLERQLFLTNDQVKNELARRPQYQEWVKGFKPFATETRPANFSLQPETYYQTPPKVNTSSQWLTRFQAAFGYTNEEITVIIRPMADEGKEPTGSMGDDAALAVMSARPRPLFHYFKQRFAQVTNPPIDPLRETFVMSLTTRLGARPNLLAESARHAHLIELTSPVLTDLDLEHLRGLGDPRFQTTTIAARYPVEQGVDGLRRSLTRLCAMAERAIDSGQTILVLSDHGVDERHAPIPSLLAVGAVHHHLIRRGKRMQASLVVESGEAREVHHLACLMGYGANAVNPYLALATIESLVEGGKIKLDLVTAKRNYIRAMEAGLLKIMSKMGISTVESYAGAQIFEAIGLSQTLVDEHFSGTVSRLGGIDLAEIAAEMRRWHAAAFGDPDKAAIDSPGFYKFKRGGELHAYTPQTVKALHDAVRLEGVLSPAAAEPAKLDGQLRSFTGENFDAGFAAYQEFLRLLAENGAIGPRDMLDFASDRDPIDVAEVEPLESIFGRFSTAAMSHGALSSEAHETLAVAMNRLGASSNSGEGGSAQARFANERNDRTKQVASGRFGVTPAYLMSSRELQIKMAQGAKPGEGGQLPGHKVTAEIAGIRHTTIGTTLISPPPHHDIYSIEDLAQLIYDLKQVNPRAEVSVKLVSEAGVGTVAAGVVKGGADTVHIAGHSGGTGAAAWSSIKNVGLPWEIGLAETQQTLQLNNLRGRVKVRTDGGLQTGRDVVIAAMLGADEVSFGTAALVAEGCLIARACHSNTCPVGVATQRPELRAKFAGQPEHVMAYMHFVAHEVRQILARLGYRSLQQVIGRTDLLRQVTVGQANIDSLDLSPLLARGADGSLHFEQKDADVTARLQVNDLNGLLLAQAQAALTSGEPVTLNLPIGSTDRTIGATLSGEIARRLGDAGLPDGTINVTFHGSAGQSFGAFNISGLNLTLVGEANDYVGKGMSGGQIVVRPPLKSPIAASENIIIGNTVLYGASGGSLFAAGQAGERFGVRNSGATAVIEGVGDHGLEYMTGGVVVVLGRTGYNFGAGMSGGVAFVLDESGTLPQRVNPDMVQVVRVTNNRDISLLRMLVMRHARLTGSQYAQSILDGWTSRLGLFWKVAPKGTVGSTAARPALSLELPTLELSQHVAG
ncbi:MAG: Ferredoxin-dependent glutamate synthase 1 [Anaerolineae bacterium]|nr:Ferredoxin-dependent glutamate synthase 1 [Anaerolineae bacterium]